MPTRYRTINLRPETYQRLGLYKIGPMTFDEVVARLLEDVPPERFYSQALAAYRREATPAGEEVEWVPEEG